MLTLKGRIALVLVVNAAVLPSQGLARSKFDTLGYGESKGLETVIVTGTPLGGGRLWIDEFGFVFAADLEFSDGGPSPGDVEENSQVEKEEEITIPCPDAAEAAFQFCESAAQRTYADNLAPCSAPAGLSRFMGGRATDICVSRAEALLRSDISACKGAKALNLGKCK